MRANEGVFSVAAMSRVLGVTRPGYYAWKRRDPGVRSRVNAVLRVEIRSIFVASRRTYGSRRIRERLRPLGYRVGRERAARLMLQEGLRAKRSRRFQATTDSRNTRVVHENVLARDFAVGRANRAWAGDITHLWTLEGWLYLAVVLDVGTRRAVGWSFRENLEAELVTGALEMALGQRPALPGLICHSDRGSQYGSGEVQAMLARFQLRGSMSGTGDCWDNAVVESFFASLKTELAAEARWASRETAKSAVVEWIEGWYNRTRLHSTLGYLSPAEFERQLAAKTN